MLGLRGSGGVVRETLTRGVEIMQCGMRTIPPSLNTPLPEGPAMLTVLIGWPCVAALVFLERRLVRE